MYLYEFNDDLGCNVRVESDNIPAQLPENCYLSETLYQPDEIRATEIIGGVVQGMEEIPGPPEIYAHLTLSGGAMGNTQYAVQQGSSLTANLKITATDDPEAAALTGITASWPIVIRDAVTGKIYNKLLAVTEGEGSASWTPPDNSDYEVREADFIAVEMGGVSYKVRLRSYYEYGSALVKIADGSAPIYAYEA